MKPVINQYDQKLAMPMFLCSLMFLLLLAGALHLGNGLESDQFSRGETICLSGLALIYPLFSLELIFRWVTGSLRGKIWVVYALCPPLRVGAKDVETGNHIWLPGYGWQHVNDRLEQQLEKKFSLPMILIALAVLPVMGAEHYYAEKVAGNATFAFSLQFATAMIWLAFTVEFLLMISIVQNKFQYSKEHWIDILVILLPLVSFLRFLRVARAGRMGRLTRLLKIQQLSKTARVYRLRGTMMRAYRAVMLLNVLGRIFKAAPETRLKKLNEEIEEKERELAELRRDVWRVRNECVRNTITHNVTASLPNDERSGANNAA